MKVCSPSWAHRTVSLRRQARKKRSDLTCLSPYQKTVCKTSNQRNRLSLSFPSLWQAVWNLSWLAVRSRVWSSKSRERRALKRLRVKRPKSTLPKTRKHPPCMCPKSLRSLRKETANELWLSSINSGLQLIICLCAKGHSMCSSKPQTDWKRLALEELSTIPKKCGKESSTSNFLSTWMNRSDLLQKMQSWRLKSLLIKAQTKITRQIQVFCEELSRFVNVIVSRP